MFTCSGFFLQSWTKVEGRNGWKSGWRSLQMVAVVYHHPYLELLLRSWILNVKVVKWWDPHYKWPRFSIIHQLVMTSFNIWAICVEFWHPRNVCLLLLGFMMLIVHFTGTKRVYVWKEKEKHDKKALKMFFRFSGQRIANDT